MGEEDEDEAEAAPQLIGRVARLCAQLTHAGTVGWPFSPLPSSPSSESWSSPRTGRRLGVGRDLESLVAAAAIVARPDAARVEVEARDTRGLVHLLHHVRVGALPAEHL